MSSMEETCKNAVEKVPEPWHIICFILNIFVPGCGTCISAFMGPSNGQINTTAFVFGLIQFFLAPSLGVFRIKTYLSLSHSISVFTTIPLVTPANFSVKAKQPNSPDFYKSSRIWLYSSDPIPRMVPAKRLYYTVNLIHNPGPNSKSFLPNKWWASINLWEWFSKSL